MMHFDLPTGMVIIKNVVFLHITKLLALLSAIMARHGLLFKVEYHANAKYENPYQNSEKNSMYWSKVNVSNNGKKIIPHHSRFLLKCHLVLH